MRPADEARLIAAPRSDEFEATELDFLRTAFLPARAREAGGLRGSLFVANRGAYGLGYNRCTWCDYAEPKKRVSTAARRGAAAQTPFVHDDPLTGKRCGNTTLGKIGVDFAHRFETDVRLLRFISPLPQPTSESSNVRLYQERIARTLAEAIRHAATDLMTLQAGELRSTYRLYSSLGNTLEVVLYDAVPGGAGYCARLATPPIFTATKLLQQARKRLECPRDCDSGCRACLCDYGNQRYWDSFERKDALAWLTATMDGSLTGTGPGSYVPWKTATLAGLAERLAPHTSVSLVCTALNSGEFSEPDLMQVKQWLDSGKRVEIYVAGRIVQHPRDFDTLTLYRHLYPYAAEGKLRLFEVHDLQGRAAVDLPRVFASLDTGAPIIKQAFPMQPLFAGLIADPAYIGSMDKVIAESIGALVKKAQPLEAKVLAEGNALHLLELRPGDARNLEEIFAAIKGAYVGEMVIRDAYCGTSKNRPRVGQLVEGIRRISSKLEKVVIHACEQKDPSGYIEHKYDVEQALEDLVAKAGVDKREATVHGYGSARRTFHDRDVTFKVLSVDGTDQWHRYFLTGGVDYLLDAKSATRVFHAQLQEDQA